MCPPNDAAYEREEDDIIARLNRGDIDRHQADKELRDLRYDQRSAYEQDMDDARRRVNDDWGL